MHKVGAASKHIMFITGKLQSENWYIGSKAERRHTQQKRQHGDVISQHFLLRKKSKLKYNMKFQVLTAASMKFRVFWDIQL
jgi:hypothetical protein